MPETSSQAASETANHEAERRVGWGRSEREDSEEELWQDPLAARAALKARAQPTPGSRLRSNTSNTGVGEMKARPEQASFQILSSPQCQGSFQ